MKRIPIRQFQQHFHASFKEVPFVVTSRGKDVYVVTPYVEQQARPVLDVVTKPLNNVVTSPKVSTQIVKEIASKKHHEIKPFIKPAKGTSAGKVTADTKQRFVNEYVEKKEDWTF